MRDFADRWMPRLLGGSACLSTAAVLAVFTFLVYASIPFFWSGGLDPSVLSDWQPKATPPSYGIGPMVVGSLLLATMATAIGFPMSLGVCLFTLGAGPRWLGRIVVLVVHAMTAIPTVVYAFVAILVLVPLLRTLDGSGYSLLSASLVLSVLIQPTMVLVMRVRMEQATKQVSLTCASLGMTQMQTLRQVVLPMSRRGMVTALMLGFCRALGDTLIAYMVTKNAAQIPTSPTDSIRTLTAHIAMQLNTDWNSLEYRSLAGAGLSLFLLTSAITIGIQWLDARSSVATGSQSRK